MEQPQAIVFDLYGTLLDVRSVAASCERQFPGHGAAISERWRSRQLEYSWQRSLMGHYAGFWQITGEALGYALASCGLSAGADERAALLAGYLRLAPFAEVPAALADLAARHRLAVLSNGTPAMISAALGHAGLGALIDPALSVDAARVYKPAPQAYALASAALGCAPGAILFVSANGWDIAGAGAFGMRTVWLNRAAAPAEALPAPPTLVLSDLAALADWLRRDSSAR